jgi:hypothetical protein
MRKQELSPEERVALSAYRIQRAKVTLLEADTLITVEAYTVNCSMTELAVIMTTLYNMTLG